MGGVSQFVKFDEVRTINYAATGAAYVAIGDPFEHVMRLVKITNNTDGDLLISTDGETDMDICPSGGFSLYDFTTNGPTGTEFVMPKGLQFYAKRSTVPTQGDLYITCVYGLGE